MNAMRFGKAPKTLLVALVVGVILLASSALSQVTRGRFPDGPGFRRTNRGVTQPPNIGRRPSASQIMDMGILEDDIEQHTVSLPFAVVQGTVFDESGKPAAGIQVTIERLDPKGSFKVKTDKNGKYSYTGLQAGDYIMGVEYMGNVGLLRREKLRNGRLFASDFYLKDFNSAGKAGTDFSKLRVETLDSPSDSVEVTLIIPSELRKLYDQALEAAARGDHQTAVALLKQLLEKAPGEVVFWLRLGESSLELSNYNDAAAAFRKAMELKPDVAEYPGLLAYTLLFIGNLDEAERYTEKAAALDKIIGAQAYFNLGLALTDSDAVTKAEAAFNKATELDEQHAGAFYQLGVTYISSHPNLLDARKALQRSLELAPGSEDAKNAELLIAEIDKAGNGGR